jgi:hypothetical protein
VRNKLKKREFAEKARYHASNNLGTAHGDRNNALHACFLNALPQTLFDA